MNRKFLNWSLAAVLVFSFAGVAQAAKRARNLDRGPVAQLEQALDQLNLSPDQQTKTNAIVDELRSQVQTIRADAKSTGDRPAAREKVRQLVKDEVAKLREVLNTDQQQKLQQLMREERAQRREQRQQRQNPSTQPTTGPASN